MAFAALSGHTTRLSAVRDSGDPAVFLATWDAAVTNPPVTCKHLNRVAGSTVTSPGLELPTSTDYADRPHAAEFNTPSLKVRLYGKPDTYVLSQALARKFLSAGDQRTWQLVTISTGALRLQTFPTGTSTAITTDSTSAVDPAAVGVGFDFTPTNGANRVTRF